MTNVVALRPTERMTAAEFKVVRERLGLPAQWVASALGVYEKTVSRWETGERGVSAEAEKLLDDIHRDTNRLVMSQIRMLDDGSKEPTLLITYRLDSDMPAMYSHEGKQLPASWHRAMTGRVALHADGPVVFAYAD